MALPWASVMVIIVLLKLALTWATPAVMFLRSRRRRRCGSRATDYRPYLNLLSCRRGLMRASGGAIDPPDRLLLLAGDRPGLALAGARVGVGALAADRQALAVPEAA